MLGHAVAKLRKIVMKVWWEGKRIYHIDDERLLGYGLLRGGGEGLWFMWCESGIALSKANLY